MNPTYMIIIIFIIILLVAIFIYAYENGVFANILGGEEQPPTPPGFEASGNGEEQPPQIPK